MDAKSAGSKSGKQQGQALLEMIFILPLIVVLIIWLLQGVEVVRASAEQQKYLRLNLFLRINNRAIYTVDSLGPIPGSEPRPAALSPTKNSMVVEYNNQAFSLKSLAGSLEEFQRKGGAQVLVRSKLGICIRPACN